MFLAATWNVHAIAWLKWLSARAAVYFALAIFSASAFLAVSLIFYWLEKAVPAPPGVRENPSAPIAPAGPIEPVDSAAPEPMVALPSGERVAAAPIVGSLVQGPSGSMNVTVLGVKVDRYGTVEALVLHVSYMFGKPVERTVSVPITNFRIMQQRGLLAYTELSVIALAAHPLFKLEPEDPPPPQPAGQPQLDREILVQIKPPTTGSSTTTPPLPQPDIGPTPSPQPLRTTKFRWIYR